MKVDYFIIKITYKKFNNFASALESFNEDVSRRNKNPDNICDYFTLKLIKSDKRIKRIFLLKPKMFPSKPLLT